jgi:hypothetical protein
LFGASAIACGYSDSLSFETETYDFKNKKDDAGVMVVGYSRADIMDEDGNYGEAGKFKENTSSLIIATYSPDNITW